MVHGTYPVSWILVLAAGGTDETADTTDWIAIMARHYARGKEDLYKTYSAEEQRNKMKRNGRLIEGVIKRYILNPRTVFDDGRLKRVAFGEKEESQPHKTILLVGETGVGKSTVVNAVVNYMLGVESEERIWFEIIETNEKQTKSQTKAVTVYDVFTEHSPFSLTIIDTPGFGSTAGIQEDLTVAESLHELFRSKDGVRAMNAVCLVMKADTSRLTQTQLYVFNAVLSLFGHDVEKNIVVFTTNSQNKPKNAMKAIKEAKVVCAKTPEGEPVCFRFNNVHCENFDDEDVLENYKSACDRLNKSMKEIVAFTNENKTVSLRMTTIVLKRRKQLTAAISNLKDRIYVEEKMLEQTKAFLQQHEKEKEEKEKSFEYMVDEPYKEKVPIERKWWQLGSREATCCRVCKENCHYPGCWWARDLSRCSVMSEDKCTVCTGRCHYTAHVKERKIYVVKTRRVTKTLDDLKKKYKREDEEIKSVIGTLIYEKVEQEKQKLKLVEECYQYVVTLDEIALKSDSVSILPHMDFLIEKMKETGERKKVEKLEEIKKRAEAENQNLLRFIQGQFRNL